MGDAHESSHASRKFFLLAPTCLVVVQHMPPASRAACLLALTLAPHARSDMEMNCQIFDSTMVCDSDKPRIARGEIRTCSG